MFLVVEVGYVVSIMVFVLAREMRFGIRSIVEVMHTIPSICQRMVCGSLAPGEILGFSVILFLPFRWSQSRLWRWSRPGKQSIVLPLLLGIFQCLIRQYHLNISCTVSLFLILGQSSIHVGVELFQEPFKLHFDLFQWSVRQKFEHLVMCTFGARCPS